MKISTASSYDYIAITAHMKALYNKKYHCEEENKNLERRIKQHKDAKPAYIHELKSKLALRKNIKGCGVVLKKLIFKKGNMEFYTCPCKIKHPLMSFLLRVEKAMSSGILPFSGGYADQPGQIIELLELVQDVKIVEERERKEREKK